jgi:hypothetical protein
MKAIINDIVTGADQVPVLVEGTNDLEVAEKLRPAAILLLPDPVDPRLQVPQAGLFQLVRQERRIVVRLLELGVDRSRLDLERDPVGQPVTQKAERPSEAR